MLPVVSYAQVPPAESPAAASKAVLVTGASTGIGRKITEHLAAKGYFVYAGARKQADLDALGAIKNVQAVKLDVTRQEDIDAAVASITKAGRGLYGLVNNAGIATAGHASPKPAMEEFDLLMEVNLLWPLSRDPGVHSADRREQGTHHHHRFDLRHSRGVAICPRTR